MQKMTRAAGKKNLAQLRLSAAAGPFVGQDPIVQKFPLNTTVKVFAGVLSKLFNLDIDRMIIRYHSTPKEPFYVLDDFQHTLLFYSVKNDGEVWVDIKEIANSFED